MRDGAAPDTLTGPFARPTPSGARERGLAREKRMILVTGSILAREDTFDDVLRSCIEHVERSRKEPGCISHDVHVDCQNPMRLFFFEQWADEAALHTHFAVEGSKAFVRSLKGRIVETSGTNIYRAEPIPR
jgi:quinol monooxygenase YgiN